LLSFLDRLHGASLFLRVLLGWLLQQTREIL
jgi:hypothetical protein